MKIIKFFLKLFLVLLVLFVVAASIYVRIYGKSLVEKALNDSLKRNVILGAASYHFPLGFQARGVRIDRSRQGGEFIKIKRIVAQLSPAALIQRKFAFETVILFEPSVVIRAEKKETEAVKAPVPSQEGASVPPVGAEVPAEKAAPAPAPAKDQEESPETKISVKRLIVRQGYLRYKDGLTEKGFSFDLEDVQMKINNLMFPLEPGRSRFELAARLVKEGNPLSGSYVNGSGWADIVKRDMDAKVEVVERDGTVGLEAKAVSKNNDMEVTGNITMQNLFQEAGKAASAEDSTVNDLVRNALSSAGVEIGAKFAFKTKMDDFRVGQVSFSGNVVTK